MRVETSSYSHRTIKLPQAQVRVAIKFCSTIISRNNTPPASRQISAPRGVTRFWGPNK